jgi:purine-binding chemotaxis protein CheW
MNEVLNLRVQFLTAAAAAQAVAPAEAPTLAASHECLTWRLGAEEYGIDILHVQEIRGYQPPTGIANAPAFIMGVLKLRGVNVPIVDLRIKLGVERATYDATKATIVLNVVGRMIGVVVDAVSDVVDLKREQIMPAPCLAAVPGAECITGIGQMQQGSAKRMLILLDAERLLRGADFGLFQTLLN